VFKERLHMRLIFILIIVSITSYGQTKTKEFQTNKYCGTFGYKKSKTNASATILVYPETDTTVLFYFDVNSGAPSYNMGSLYGRLKIVNEQGIYKSKNQDCHWSMQILKNKLIIQTVNELYNCGFGNGVVADGTFKKTSKKIPNYFVTGEVFF
jgi:hypothetical protein